MWWAVGGIIAAYFAACFWYAFYRSRTVEMVLTVGPDIDAADMATLMEVLSNTLRVCGGEGFDVIGVERGEKSCKVTLKGYGAPKRVWDKFTHDLRHIIDRANAG